MYCCQQDIAVENLGLRHVNQPIELEKAMQDLLKIPGNFEQILMSPLADDRSGQQHLMVRANTLRVLVGASCEGDEIIS